jgi:hypothetical protein
LEIRLAQLLGKEARVWRDPKLCGNDVFAECLVQKLPQVAALVSVLSPRYVKSEWCQRELTEFIKAAEASGPLRVGDKLRVFKVVKTPVATDQHPPVLQHVLGYEFYTFDSASTRPRELSQTDAVDAQRLYWAKLDDLAHDIADLVESLEEDGAGASRKATNGHGAEKPTVYLAETSNDLREKRDIVRRDLLDRGCIVVPDRALPLVAAECESYIAEQLARSRLSVHLVGSNYGIVPEGSTESIVALQNELAVRRGEAGDFCRLVWIPPELETNCPRQRAFLDLIQNDPRIQTGADLLITPLEDFKNVLHVRLEPRKPVVASDQRDHAPALDGHQVLRVYLICDQRDLEDVAALEDYLFQQGCETILPAFQGDEAQLRRDHEENLAACDAALVYYGAGNDLWLRSTLRELQKVAGYGRAAPMRAKAIYIAPPDAVQKQRFRTHEALVLRGAAAFEPQAMAPFIAAMQ